MLPRDCLCGYPKRPPVDFPRRSVGRPTKTFQYFHRAAARYDAAAQPEASQANYQQSPVPCADSEPAGLSLMAESEPEPESESRQALAA